ncbi:hypothetical protein GX51_02901 [Blastomyces parvus]|uniref:Uncharacterized protein n=1 Tax=Blastomyces parvus TaxID=2060905 RepID=A0A2B7XA04_9EURO|nr:hypothetical protein GX51_02901 [Blastomyces parvus]
MASGTLRQAAGPNTRSQPSAALQNTHNRRGGVGRRACQAIDYGDEAGMAGNSWQGGQSSGGSASRPRGGEDGELARAALAKRSRPIQECE